MKPSVCNSGRSVHFPEICEDDFVFIPINKLTDVNPDRNHAYVLPNDDVYIVNHAGSRVIKLSSSSDDPIFDEVSDGLEIVTANKVQLLRVRVGDGMLINEDNQIILDPKMKYVLPVATDETLGGVKLGEHLSSDKDGKVSVELSLDDLGGQPKLAAGSGIIIDENDSEKPIISTESNTHVLPNGTNGIAIADGKVALAAKNLFTMSIPEETNPKVVMIIRRNGGSLALAYIQPYLTAGYGLEIDETDPKAPVISVDGDFVTADDLEQAKYESSANVINIVTGKKEVELTFILDLKDKIAGSDVENKHSYRYVSLTDGVLPAVPVIGTELENTGDWKDYGLLYDLDNKIFTTTTATAGKSAAHVARWNLLEEIKEFLGDKFFTAIGATDVASQVAFIRSKGISLVGNTWGFGSSASGNKLSCGMYRQRDKDWPYNSPNTQNSVKKMSSNINPSSIPFYIADDGFVTEIAYAEPSDGVTQSAARADYSNLEFKMKISMSEYFNSLIAQYHGENPPEWSEVTEKPFETLGVNLEVVDGKLNASGGIAASQIEVNEGNIPDKYISPKTLAEWENEQLLKRGKQMVLGENRQLESPSDMNFGKFGISDNYKAGTFKNEQPNFTVDEVGDVTVVKAGQYLISGICKRQYKRLVSIWHYISLIHKDVTSGNETQLDLFPLGGSVQNRNKQYGQTVRQCKVGDKIWMSSTSSAGPGNANADALQYLNVDFFTMERLGD